MMTRTDYEAGLPDRGRGMYGPFRRATAVGPHEATGTTVTLECGHTWTLVPHMHIDRERGIGELHQCGDCQREEEAR